MDYDLVLKTISLLLEVLHEVVDKKVYGLVDVPLHICLGEDAFGGPTVLHVFKEDDLQLIAQNLRRGRSHKKIKIKKYQEGGRVLTFSARPPALTVSMSSLAGIRRVWADLAPSSSFVSSSPTCSQIFECEGCIPTPATNSG